jgi:hypothetical protein
MQSLLGQQGFEGELVDETPQLQGTSRREEIEAWLHENEVRAYVVIDDDLSCFGMQGRVVHTSARRRADRGRRQKCCGDFAQGSDSEMTESTSNIFERIRQANEREIATLIPAAVRQLLEDGCTVLFKGDGERSQDRYTWVVDCSSTGPIRRDTSRPAKTFQEICAVYVGEHRASKGEPSPNFPFKGCSDFECDFEEIHAEIELLMANGVVACAYINTDTDPCITWHVSLPDPGALPDSVQFSERGPDLQAVAERYWSRRGE